MINYKKYRCIWYSYATTLLVILLIITSCAALKQVTQTLTNLKRLQYKLENVNGFQMAGIGFNAKSSIRDFSLTDGLRLTQAFASKRMPAEFILNIAARNPNDGTGGTKQTTATLTSLAWDLYIDDVHTVSGRTDTPVDIPGMGQTSLIPIRISLDLIEFFEKKGYDGIINLALALGGVNSSPARLRLDATPTVSTPIGPISSGKITIIDKQFN